MWSFLYDSFWPLSMVYIFSILHMHCYIYIYSRFLSDLWLSKAIWANSSLSFIKLGGRGFSSPPGPIDFWRKEMEGGINYEYSIRIFKYSMNVNTKKKYRQRRSVFSTAWRSPKEKGPPHDSIIHWHFVQQYNCTVCCRDTFK